MHQHYSFLSYSHQCALLCLKGNIDINHSRVEINGCFNTFSYKQA